MRKERWALLGTLGGRAVRVGYGERLNYGLCSTQGVGSEFFTRVIAGTVFFFV